MPRKMTSALCLFGILLLSGCSEPSGDNLKKAEWMLGTWENRTNRGSIFEHWQELNPREYEGKSYMLNEGDTVVFETIRLVEKDEILTYIPTVANQNQSKPVQFRASTVSKNEMVFENKEHDFPQEISYLRLSKDSLVAKIRGTKNGAEDERVFPMSRVK